MDTSTEYTAHPNHSTTVHQNHRDLVNDAKTAYEQDAYENDRKENDSLLMRNGWFLPELVQKRYPNMSEYDAKDFCDNMNQIKADFAIKESDMGKFGEYILDNTARLPENANYDFSGEYPNDPSNEDMYGSIVNDPFPCVCADMLRCDTPDGAKIFNMDARTVTGMVGMLSQGIPWEQVEAMTEGRDGLDVMAMENYAFRHHDASYKDIESVHAELTFDQFTNLKYQENAWDTSLQDDFQRTAFEEYKNWDHASSRDILKTEMQRDTYQRLIQPTADDIEKCSALAKAYDIPIDVALAFGPKDIVPDVFNIAERDDFQDRPIEDINIYAAYKNAIAQGIENWDMSRSPSRLDQIRLMLNENSGLCHALEVYDRDLYDMMGHAVRTDFMAEQYQDREEKYGGITEFIREEDNAKVMYNQDTDRVTLQFPCGDDITGDGETIANAMSDASLAFCRTCKDAFEQKQAEREIMELQPEIQKTVQKQLQDIMVPYQGRKGLVLDYEEPSEPDDPDLYSADYHLDIDDHHVKYSVWKDEHDQSHLAAAVWAGGEYTGLDDMRGGYVSIPLNASFLNEPNIDVIMPYRSDEGLTKSNTQIYKEYVQSNNLGHERSHDDDDLER